MAHDFHGWIRRTRFPSERLWPVDHSLPEPIQERLAALEQAERRRCDRVAAEWPDTNAEPSERHGIRRPER